MYLINSSTSPNNFNQTLTPLSVDSSNFTLSFNNSKSIENYFSTGFALGTILLVVIVSIIAVLAVVGIISYIYYKTCGRKEYENDQRRFKKWRKERGDSYTRLTARFNKTGDGSEPSCKLSRTHSKEYRPKDSGSSKSHKSAKQQKTSLKTKKTQSDRSGPSKGSSASTSVKKTEKPKSVLDEIVKDPVAEPKNIPKSKANVTPQKPLEKPAEKPSTSASIDAANKLEVDLHLTPKNNLSQPAHQSENVNLNISNHDRLTLYFRDPKTSQISNPSLDPQDQSTPNLRLDEANHDSADVQVDSTPTAILPLQESQRDPVSVKPKIIKQKRVVQESDDGSSPSVSPTFEDVLSRPTPTTPSRRKKRVKRSHHFQPMGVGLSPSGVGQSPSEDVEENKQIFLMPVFKEGIMGRTMHYNFSSDSSSDKGSPLNPNFIESPLSETQSIVTKEPEPVSDFPTDSTFKRSTNVPCDGTWPSINLGFEDGQVHRRLASNATMAGIEDIYYDSPTMELKADYHDPINVQEELKIEQSPQSDKKSEENFEVIEISEAAKNSEVTENTSLTENSKETEITEVIEFSEVAKNSEVTENFEKTVETKITEVTEISEAAKNSEITENSGLTENSKETEITEVTEISKVAKNFEVTENSGLTENFEKTEETEITENSEAAKNSKVTENSGSTEITEQTQITEVTEISNAAKNSEETENSRLTENSEETDITGATENSEETDITELTKISEAAKNFEITENSGLTENSEETEISEVEKNSEVTENSGLNENFEKTEETEITENSGLTEITEETEQTEITEVTENSGLTEITEEAKVTKEPENTEQIQKPVPSGHQFATVFTGRRRSETDIPVKSRRPNPLKNLNEFTNSRTSLSDLSNVHVTISSDRPSIEHEDVGLRIKSTLETEKEKEIKD